jgi:hypothetical protein
MAHTPGPWSTFQDASLRHTVGAATVRICEMWGRDPAFFTEEDAANARLIAAAPELLESLRDLLGYIKATENASELIDHTEFCLNCRDRYPEHHLENAEAAIDKATGQEEMTA